MTNIALWTSPFNGCLSDYYFIFHLVVMIRFSCAGRRWSHPRTLREHTGNQDLMILRRHLNYMAQPCTPLMETSPQIGGLIAIPVQRARTFGYTEKLRDREGYGVLTSSFYIPWLHEVRILKKRTFQIMTPRKIYDISWVPQNVDSRRPGPLLFFQVFQVLQKTTCFASRVAMPWSCDFALAREAMARLVLSTGPTGCQVHSDHTRQGSWLLILQRLGSQKSCWYIDG